MSLTAGERLGSYEIIGVIGAGAMGEVYRARDTRLNREVAIKILPSAVAGDAERLARFHREAQVLASLNHPNIAAIYGFEDTSAVHALVMELVEGPTLADRIARGPIPLDDALPIARQIADALEAAHEQGIVHRDLKPANIKLRTVGTVKVLDFGLARSAVEPATGGSASLLPTLASDVGVIVGTAAYMSPEQAKGKSVDRRADIWAFGVVFAEMLTGTRMFAGDTVSETLASVIKDTPVIPDAPPAIRMLLTRCLERDPRARLRDIGEARIVLEDPASATSAATAVATRGSSPRPSVMWVLVTVAAAIAGAAVMWFVRPGAAIADVPLRKFTLPVDNLFHGPSRTPQISPDGTKIVYSTADRRLWVRDLAAFEPRAIVTGGDPQYYSWSPDGAQIGYLSNDRIMKVPAAGGAAAVVAVLRQSLGSGIGTAWMGRDIVLTTGLPGTGLQRVSADGGDLSTFLAPESKEYDFHEVSPLPDGNGLLYALDRGAGIVDTIMMFAGGSAKEVLRLEGETLRAPLYAQTGHILYERTTNNPGIWALPFSLDALAPTGDPFLIVPQGTFPSVARDGTLMFMPPVSAGLQEIVWVDRTGALVDTIGRSLPGLAAPSLSPDGRLLAATALDNQRSDIWIFDTVRNTQRRLTFGDNNHGFPAWSPSDGRVVFSRAVPPRQSPRTILSQSADGTGQSQVLVKTERAVAPAVSPDGKFIVYSDSGADSVRTGTGLWYAPLDGSSPPRAFVDDAGNQTDPRFSPDGRYLAYQSAESGRFEVYVKTFPSGEGKWQVSVNGGFSPRWGKRVNQLFFLEFSPLTTKVMEADVSTAGAFTVGTPRVITDFTKIGFVMQGWDMNADGTRFVVPRLVPSSPRQSASMTIIQNWFAEFRNRRP